MDTIEILEKIHKTIVSCRTLDQLHSCETWLFDLLTREKITFSRAMIFKKRISFRKEYFLFSSDYQEITAVYIDEAE